MVPVGFIACFQRLSQAHAAFTSPERSCHLTISIWGDLGETENWV